MILLILYIFSSTSLLVAVQLLVRKEMVSMLSLLGGIRLSSVKISIILLVIYVNYLKKARYRHFIATMYYEFHLSVGHEDLGAS